MSIENIQSDLSLKYESLSLDEKKMLHNLYFQEEKTQSDLYKKLRKIIFKIDPPTPEQFLDPANNWLTQSFTDSLYPHVKEDFLEITNYDKKYKQIVEYGATRLGKSYLGRLIIMYVIVWCHCLRTPQLYYGLAPTTALSIYIMCFNAEKVKQLLLKPIYDLLSMSPRFKKIKFQDKVAEEQSKVGDNIIVWSKAATFGELTLASNVTINVGTDFLSFIGADLLYLHISEIAFFIDKMGATHEEIFQIYSDGLDRIKATVGNNYMGSVFLDTSANEVDNVIEKYILNDLQFQDKVFFRKRARWEARPHMFPIWLATGKTFQVCVGNSHLPAKIINNPIELIDIPKNIIIDVPIDVKDEFDRNIGTSIKNIAGMPTIKENRFINNRKLIDNIFDYPLLKNVEGSVLAESTHLPDKLIWNQICDTFFSMNVDGKYVIYRAPQEPRFVGLDLSYSLKGDATGFACIHKEWSTTKECIMYIVDFCFAIISKESAINLEATPYLIMNLRDIGQLPIISVAVDQFQSQTLLQYLERSSIAAVKQSVDISLNPYQFLLTCISPMNECLKAGKNIFLYNNLDSLIYTKLPSGKEKIDHVQGKINNIYNGDFEKSTAGINAKDISDAVTTCLWSAKNDTSMPYTIFEEEHKRFSIIEEDKSKLVSKAWNRIHTKY
jgi:hypothetical protein